MPTMMQESSGSCNVSGWGTLRSGEDLKTQIQTYTITKDKRDKYEHKHMHKYKRQKDKHKRKHIFRWTDPGRADGGHRSYCS